ncbi:MAG: RNA-directed DNA polymerase [Ruminococcus flavefaciens]|nr:RNA-directed DNA polymerase [Ruminococcus flavefaciens]
MPKRVGNLYQQMLDKGFIRETIILAAEHKHNRFDVKPVLRNLDYYVDKTFELLNTNSYKPTKPKEREIYDTSSEKWRVIKIVPFWPDGVVQWLMVRVLQPVMLRGMYHWSCASIPFRGGRRTREYTERILREDPINTAFAEELDVKQFYPSIQVDLLMRELARKVKDSKFLALVRAVLMSASDENGKGVAIGFYICQWLANYFLESVDLFIKKLRGIKYYTRYMDNMNLYSHSKELLHAARLLIQMFLQSRLGLAIKKTWQVYQTAKRKVAAVGYRFARGLVILRKRNLLRIMRQCRRLQKKIDHHFKVPLALARGLLSRSGQLKHCCSQTVYDNYLPKRNIDIMKEVVRNESKRQRFTQYCFLNRTAA